MLTQNQIAQQMIAQLRVLDPSVSAEIGTPERKILDTVAQAIAEAGVDLNVVGGGLDLASKFGSDLDNYVALFGFGRQTGAFATGYVTFGRPTASVYPITIPKGTQVTATVSGSSILFQTVSVVTLVAGQTQVTAPIQCALQGTQGNVAANTITQFANVGSPPLGITTVNNELPTTGGADLESDAELKVRFKNTVFRNMAGTEDQYLALALSTQFTTKANVVGPISRYREYFQVPLVDDSTDETGQTITIYSPDGTYTVTAPTDGPGGGPPGQWTTTPSNNPYAKYIYTDVPYFMSNGGSGTGTLFYTSGVDFVINAPPIDQGETYREFQEVPNDIPDPATTPNNPNFTLFNVYTGTDITVQLPRPNDVVLCEYSYMSAESRNDITRQVLNCVDVYINGENALTGDAVIPVPTGLNNIFNSNPIDVLYNQNFRRLGEPTITPVLGNLFQPLFFQPVIDLPDQIVAGDFTYFKGINYWCVQDWTLLGSSVRARNGIEWDPTQPGMAFGDPTVTIWVPGLDWTVGQYAFYNGIFYTAVNTLTNDQTTPPSDPTNWTAATTPFTGQPIVSSGVTSFTVIGYTYDRNIIDLQASINGAKQVTTDVLAHRARSRYFKLDLTIIYSPGQLASAVNPLIRAAVQNYFDGQYFGSVILLSDLLVTVRQVTGVANVRWSNDVINPNDDGSNLLNRVTECDIDGNMITSFNTDFFLRDNELPTLPKGQITGDTLPGLILRPRSENTFNFT